MRGEGETSGPGTGRQAGSRPRGRLGKNDQSSFQA
jgi:hypothetical protein